MKSLLKIFGYIILFIAVSGIVLIGFYYKRQKDECEGIYRKERDFPVHLISLSNLEVRTGGAEVTGRIANKSQQVIFGFSLDIVANDCVASNCSVVGKHTFFLQTIIPPGEARDFTATEHLGNLLTKIRPRGDVRFTGQIVSPGAVPEHESMRCAG